MIRGCSRSWCVYMTVNRGTFVNRYIKGEERSFTIVAYPVPEIGERYSEIFDDVIRINTLDAGLYERVQADDH